MYELGSLYSLTKHRKPFSLMIRVTDCYVSDLSSMV